MKLGSVWGMTAPMILLANLPYDFINAATSDRYARHCLKSEMAMLLNTLKKSDVLPMVGTVHEGEIPVTVSERNEFAVCMAEEIVRGIQRGRLYDLPSTKERVKEAIREKADAMIATGFLEREWSRKVKEAARSFVTNSGVFDDVLVLAMAFDLQLQAPERVVVQGESIPLSEPAKSIWNQLLLQVDVARQCVVQMASDVQKEIIIFDSDASDLLMRKPNSLLYIVLNIFSYVKGKNNAIALQNTISNVQQNLDKYRRYLMEYVVLVNQQVSTENVTEEDWAAIRVQLAPEKKRFFEAELSSGLRLEDFSKKQFDVILKMYDIADSLSKERLQSVYGITHGVSEELLSVGIYGINARSLDLLSNSLTTSLLVVNQKITKSQEELDAIMFNITEIQTLLDTLIPIGKEI